MPLPAQRLALALRWAAFGIGALAACCATPYGWGSILASLKILSLGELLHLDCGMDAGEFQSTSIAFELVPPRLDRRARSIAASSCRCRGSLWYWACCTWRCPHVRNLELFALLLPLAVLDAGGHPVRPACANVVRLKAVPAALLVAGLCAATWFVAARRTSRRRRSIRPLPPLTR